MFEDRIAGLRTDLISYGNEIVEHVNSLYSSKRLHSSVIDLKSDPKNMISMLSHEFAELMGTNEQSDNAKVHMDAVKECSELISLLDEVTTVVASFAECEKAINAYKVLIACKYVVDIEAVLAKLTGKASSAIATGKVFSNLREEHKRLTNKLLSKLRRALTECIRFENGRIIVIKTLQGVLRSEDIVLEDAVKLSELWESVVALKVADDFASSLTSDVWQHILKPLWSERKLTSPKAKSEGESGAELVFESITKQSKELSSHDGKGSRRPPNPCKVPVSTLLDCVGVVLSFMWSDMLCGNEQVALSVYGVWTATNTSLIEPILESVTAHLPKVEAELAAYKKSLERPCHDFEERFGRFHSVAKGSVDAPLTSYLTRMADMYADARRTDILRRAREIVLADYHNTMLAGGDALEDDPTSAGDIGDARALIDQSGFGMQKLKFDSCQVSLTANRILKLVHEVMRQACEASSKSIANVLVQSARDCLDIFIAVVPMKFSSVIDALPRMGGVFYNDCVYIAHNSVLITHKYRQELIKADEAFQGCIGFVDFIPRFRSVGEQCLRNHLEDQRMALAEHIRGICITPDGEADPASAGEAVVPTPASLLKGLTSKIAPKGGHSGAAGVRGGNALVNDEQSTLKLVEALDRLSEQWRGVLQEGVYSRVLGNLLNGIIVGLMQPVLVANCVSVEASSEINRIYKTVQSLRSIFPSEYKDEDSLQTICPQWKKFVALTDLLDYSLGDVAEWLPRKKFSSFTGQEMTSLIKALFEDTEKRLQILQSILAMTS